MVEEGSGGSGQIAPGRFHVYEGRDMRWNTPTSGDKRTVRRFALWPVDLAYERVTVWLEWYTVKQVYLTGFGWCQEYLNR